MVRLPADVGNQYKKDRQVLNESPYYRMYLLRTVKRVNHEKDIIFRESILFGDYV